MSQRLPDPAALTSPPETAPSVAVVAVAVPTGAGPVMAAGRPAVPTPTTSRLAMVLAVDGTRRSRSHRGDRVAGLLEDPVQPRDVIGPSGLELEDDLDLAELHTLLEPVVRHPDDVGARVGNDAQ